MRIAPRLRSASSGLQDLGNVIWPTSTILLNISTQGPFSSAVSASSQPFLFTGLPSCCTNHLSLVASGHIQPSGSYRLIVTERTILLVNTAPSRLSIVAKVTSGPVGIPALLFVTFTVNGIQHLSVSVFHGMPSTAPPSFWTIGPSSSPEQATTLRLKPPLAMIWANVPVVCQLSKIFPLSFSRTAFSSDPLGRSSTNLSSSIIRAAT